MNRFPLSLACCVLMSISLEIAQSSEAQEEEHDSVKDPCAELLAIDTSEFSDDEELASQQLEQSINLLDDCLNSLLLGVGGTGGTGVANNLDDSASPLLLLPQGKENPSAVQNPGTLSGSLTELDNLLDGVEIQLDPLNENTGSTNGRQMDSEPLSELSELNTQKTDPGEPQGDLEGGEELKSDDKVDNESQHAEKNRQPADPKDEDAVLKQIREAAEKETDPDTKEALWDQYYDYLDIKKRSK